MPKRVRVLFILIIMTGVIGTIAYYIKLSLPNFNHIPPYEYYDNFSQDSMCIVFEDERAELESVPFFVNDEMYIPVDFVENYIDEYIFWDAKILTVTTSDRLVRMRPSEGTYYINQEPFALDIPILEVDGMAYMPATLLKELYSVEIRYEGEYSIVVVDLPDRGFTTATITAKRGSTKRYEADKKSPIQKKLPNGETVRIYDESGDYTRVRSQEGLLGYVLTKDITQLETVHPTPIVEPEIVQKEQRLNLVWDVITTKQANLNENKRKLHDGLDILSPTWFSFDAEKLNGDIISLADRSYVDWAHENGYKVWALISDNFSAEVSHAVLSDTEVREHVISQLLTFVTEYNLDGINVDYEMVRYEDARYFLQFLRELSPLLKQRQVVLSVDMFVPLYTRYYNRTEIARVVDYIVIMAYDEHYFYSDVSGPVASIPFVERGITDTLEEVPKEKIILGLPYYVRIWIEETTNGETSLRARDVGMNFAYSIFSEQNVEFEWLDDVKYHYGEYYDEEGDTTTRYHVWLEDLKSLEEKLKLAVKYDLVGFAGWRRDLESEGVWELIKEYKTIGKPR